MTQVDDVLDPLAVYIHWPYCARICPYCDFNVYKRRADPGLNAAIISDLKGWRDWSGARDVSSIHFGGGTPSLMESREIADVIKTISELWGLVDNYEIAMEANPHDANRDNWVAYRDAGIDRLSLGVQTFNDPALKFLGRDHDAKQARAALELAQSIFPSVSLDLIFGWAGQTEAQWQRDIDIALSAGPQHISAYQLTIEDGTAFGRAEGRGEKRAVPEDDSAHFYGMSRAQFIEAGYAHYEVSNFATPAHKSQHNLAYWEGRDYVGVGPGAHGRLTVEGQRFATVAEMKPKDYQHSVKTAELGVQDKVCLAAEDWAEEYVLMGLRISEGISATWYEAIAGQPLVQSRIDNLIKEGLLQQDGDRLHASDKGRLLLNWVTDKLLVG